MSEYQPPSWAGNARPGLHLDVVKNGSVLQKLLIDEKSYYLFGRNADVCDFPLQHQSCSRIHTALVHHKHLGRPFLIDLGSGHGTFVGTIRLEPQKPQQLLVDATFSFGASSRSYTLRERPQTVSLVAEETEGDAGMLLGIADIDNEVDDLTQYNTAHNRQVSMVGVSDEMPRKRQRHSSSVTFADEEEIINPEDVDPTIGRFRNMIQSSLVPMKRPRLDSDPPMVPIPSSPISPNKFTQPLSSATSSAQLYSDFPLPSPTTPTGSLGFTSSFLSRIITAAPPVENPVHVPVVGLAPVPPAMWAVESQQWRDDEPRKKKYAKEAWPGKKASHLLV